MHILNLPRRGIPIFLKGLLSSFMPIIAGMTGLNLGLPTAWVVKRKKCGCNDQLPLP